MLEGECKLEATKSSSLQVELENAQTKINQLQAAVNTLSSESASVVRQLKTETDRRVEAAQRTLDQRDVEFAAQERQLRAVQEDLQRAQTQIADLQQQLVSAKAERAQDAASKDDLQMLESYKARIKTLEQQVAAHKLELACVRMDSTIGSSAQVPAGRPQQNPSAAAQTPSSESTRPSRKRPSPTQVPEGETPRTKRRAALVATEAIKAGSGAPMDQDNGPATLPGLAELAANAPAPSPFVLRRATKATEAAVAVALPSASAAAAAAPTAAAPITVATAPAAESPSSKAKKPAARRKSLVTFQDAAAPPSGSTEMLPRAEPLRDLVNTASDTAPLKSVLKKAATVAPAAPAAVRPAVATNPSTVSEMTAKRVPATAVPASSAAGKIRTRRAGAPGGADDEAECKMQ
jgi:hypothetical protein